MKVVLSQDRNKKTLTTDTNGDGKPDIFDYYSADGALIERRENRNFDEKIDRITLFPVYPGNKLIIKSDENFDGIYERNEERWQDGDDIVVHIKIDTKSRGIFDFETTDRYPRDKALEVQGRNDCAIKGSTKKQIENIQGLSKLLGEVAATGPLRDGFYSTNFGYKIQKECADKIGANEIVNLISNSLKKGLACQWELGSPQSKANVHKIASLLLDEKNPPKIICDEVTFNWGATTLARSSLPGDKNHPFISFNPSNIKGRPKERSSNSIYNGFMGLAGYSQETDTKKLTGVFFHELMHNIGYFHGVDIEFPYACEACCFNLSADKSDDLACKICKGQYWGTMDRNYVEDVTTFFSLDGRGERNLEIILNYLRTNPNDRWGRFKLLEIDANSIDHPSPLKLAIAQALEARYSPMSPDERSKIDKIGQNKKSDYTKLFLSPSRSLAESLLNFLDGDLKGAEAELKKIQIPNRPSTSVSQIYYDYMAGMITDMKRSISWKIYKQYNESGNGEARDRVFLEFLHKKK
jgi:hypothetical protein